MKILGSRFLVRLLLWLSFVSSASHAVFAQAPTIASFTPATGPAKRMITVTGTNFAGVGITNRLVFVNGTPVVTTATATATQLIFAIPDAATSGPIVVQTSQGSATSATPLVVGSGPAPANDQFASAIELSGSSGFVIGTNANATKEAGEPNHGNNLGGASLWYRWTAPSTGTFLFNPHITPTTNFGVLQGIYTGSDVSMLTVVASGSANSSATRYASATALTATAGTTYHIAIDGFNGFMGDFRLNWAPLAAPTVTTINPATGYVGQIGTFTITGTGFVPAAPVVIAGTPLSASVVTVNSPTSISVSRLPLPATPATAPVTVTTAAGIGTSPGLFNLTATPAPVIATFSPSNGGAGSMVNLTGTALFLSNGASIFFNGTRCIFVSVTNSNTISARVPSGATSGPITIETPGGTAVSPGNFTVTNSFLPPTIFGFSPGTGSPGTEVTITGQSFVGATSVAFNGGNATFTVPGDNIILATVPAGATSGPITVTNPAGFATSNTTFTVVNSPPTVSSFTPASGLPGGNVTITGANFASTTGVTFNGNLAAYIIDSPTQITATVPNVSPTSGPITITNPAGSASSTGNFTILSNLIPTITSFLPTTTTPTLRVVITGTNFTGVQSVQFGGVSAQFTIDSQNQISARTPFGLPPTGLLTVTSANGTGVSATPYSVIPPAVPSISSFSPAVISPGTTVSIVGNGFSDVTSVLFNGQPSTFTVSSPTLLLATAPSSGLTAGPIVVNTSIGTASSATNYTLSLAPVITAITPSFGPEKRVITVSGANFSGTGIANQVLLVNGTPIGSFSRSATTYTFAVPAGATTGPITLQTSQGFATSPSPFVVATGPAPAHDNFANALVITGPTGLLNGNTANATKEPGEPNHANNPGGASVWFSWTAPTSGLYLFNPSNSSSSQFGIIQTIYTGNDLTSLTMVASGLTPINVFARYGSAAVLNAIAGTTYRIALDGYNGVMADYRLTWGPLAAPTISGFTPSGATAGQTINVNVNGANFTPGSLVILGGAQVEPARLNFQNPNLITITQIPLTAVTGPISVSTPAGSVTSAASFIVTPPPAPTIATFSPNGAKVGTAVTITGTNFTGTLAVLFNGVAASPFTVTGNSTITTAVPAAASSGPITVTTPGGSATSSLPFTVIVLPTFTQHPQSQTTIIGSTVLFSVAVNSNGPEEYYWTKNGATVLGNPSASTSTLTLSSVSLADAGEYRCVVVNNAGPTTSEPAVLTVNKIPASIALAGLAPTYDGTPKAASAMTTPAALGVTITYDGSTTPPTAAGAYALVATIVDPTYTGSATGTLTIAKAAASISFDGLAQVYTGAPRIVTPVTAPAGLVATLTYAGSPTAPINAGSYAIAATVVDPNYTGSAGAFLTVTPAPATIMLAGLVQRYDGTPRIVSATTTPAGLNVVLTYNGQPAAPVLPGAYAIVATLDEANYSGLATGTLLVGTTAVVRHAPALNGGVDGSVHVMSGESIALNGSAWVSGDLLVPGTPHVQENGHSTYAGTIDANGNETPSGYAITLNGSAVLRHVIRRVNPLELPAVAAPPAPAGTRNISLNSSAASPGDFATLRHLTLNGNAGDRAVPPGTYGDFTVNGSNSLILGDAFATEPRVYHFQSLTLNGDARLQLAGPVAVIVAGNVTLGGSAGNPANPGWFLLRVADGNVTLNGNAALAADVTAPNGEVTINAGTLTGSVNADKLRINGQGLLAQPVD